jgi:hypothetical protein
MTQACGQNQAGGGGGELFDGREIHGLGSFIDPLAKLRLDP